MKKMDALDPATMTGLLREGVLAIRPEHIGLTTATCPSVWGVMMELADADVVVSLVALVDGSVSIYLSDGSGVIGCGLHPDVRAVAAKMLHVAAQVVDQCQPTERCLTPTHHQVRFHLLTINGLFSGVANRAELDEGAEALAELYYAAHGVIGMVELLGAGVDLVDEMRLAQTTAQHDGGTDLVSHITSRVDEPEFKARGRGCRILPYVGAVARRSRS